MFRVQLVVLEQRGAGFWERLELLEVNAVVNDLNAAVGDSLLYKLRFCVFAYADYGIPRELCKGLLQCPAPFLGILGVVRMLNERNTGEVPLDGPDDCPGSCRPVGKGQVVAVDDI